MTRAARLPSPGGTEVDPVVGNVRRALHRRRDVRVAIVFGSRARGTARGSSDVDVAVLAPDADVLALAADLSSATGVDADVVELDRAGIPLLERIIREGVVVHEGAPGAAAAWRSRTLGDLEIDRPWFARMRDAWLARVAERGL